MSKTSRKRAVDDTFGGKSEYGGGYTNCANAYMLVYVRRDHVNSIFKAGGPPLVNPARRYPQNYLAVCRMKSSSGSAAARKEEKHLYTKLRVATESNLAAFAFAGWKNMLTLSTECVRQRARAQ